MFDELRGFFCKDQVNNDFLSLKSMLQNTRYKAITENKTLVARFVGKESFLNNSADWDKSRF